MLAYFVFCAISIGKHFPGIKMGAKDPEIELDVYCDPLCSDCAYVWPQIKKLLALYTTMQVRFHTMPLCIHTWSYHAVKAVQALKLMSGEEKAIEMLEKLYADHDQNQFLNSAMFNTSESGAVEKYCDYVSQKFGVDRDKYKELYNDPSTRSAASAELTFATIHGVLGTPTYDCNGVRLDFNEDTTDAEWIEFLDSLV